MPLWRRHVKQQPGKVITAQSLRQVAETADFASQIRAGGGINMNATAGGAIFTLAKLFGVYVCVASSTITARSGATLGTGTATIQTISNLAAPTLAALPGTPDLNVYNISSASGGIASGKYMVVLRITGIYVIITAEC